MLSVLQAAGLNPNTLALVYGEYRQHESTSPIWDLTLFAELMDWAQALGVFLKTGVAGPVVQLGDEMRRREADRANASNSRDFPRFGQLTKAIERFADDLATVRAASIITGYEQEDSRKPDARGSAANLLAAIEQCRKEAAHKLPAVALILDELAERVRPLSANRLFGENGQRAQHALAHHYLRLARYPEAAVVAREARVSRLAGDERAVEVNSPRFDQEERRIADLRFGQRDANAEWASGQGIAIDKTVEHLDLADVQPGDVVIGTLPVHLAAEVCARRARYLHLAVELPAEHLDSSLPPKT